MNQTPASVTPTNSAAEPAVMPSGCAFFHVTHWKAGSQWLRGILEDLFGSRVEKPQYYVRHIWAQPPHEGMVYPCVYAAKPEFDTLEIDGEKRVLVLIRDLRDTLVSAWYSFRNTHEVKIDELSHVRQMLRRLDQEQGLLYLLETWLGKSARIQRTWLAARVPCYKLEDCMADAAHLLDKMLRQGWGVELAPEQLAAVAERHSFSRISGGRPPGREDLGSHYRKGQAGDWRSHFTPRVSRRFGELYGDVLIQSGYEEDRRWSDHTRTEALSAA